MSETDDVGRALQQAESARLAGAGLVEWRLDELAMQPGATAAALRLVRDSPLPSIVTCRPEWEGGGYTGDETQRLGLFETILAQEPPPRYLDIELRALERDAGLETRLAALIERQGEHARSGLIVSSHDHQGRPADLLQRLEAIAARPSASVVKLAWRARSLRDNLEAFELLGSRQLPSIMLCMGPFGLPSRVLAGKFGGLLTFAAASADEATAPGQPTIEVLRQRYRFDAIGPATLVYGVIGWPVAHSLGPLIHNAGFTAVGHDGVYLPLPVPPQYEHFKATVHAMLDCRPFGFAGASVTLPHKEHLVRFVREAGGEVDDLGARCGAANTLAVRADGSIACANTDGPALVEAIVDGMGHDGALAGRPVAILGAGGVARAAAAAFSGRGAEVVVYNRTAARAASLAADLGVRVGDPASLNGAGVIVNCTSVGMRGGPAPEASPLETLAGRPIAIDPAATVLETIYTPKRTPLVLAAEAAGARVITGDEIFVRQAALQFTTWTAAAAPMELFRRIVSA